MTITLNFLVNDTQKTVIWAEAGKDFIDMITSMLPNPLGQTLNRSNSQLTSANEAFVSRDIKYLVSDDLSITRPTFIETIGRLKASGVTLAECRVIDVTVDDRKARELLNHLMTGESFVLTKTFKTELGLRAM